MGYEPGDGGMFEKTSGKRLAILFGLAFFGAFMVIQMIQGFPIVELFVKETVTEQVAVQEVLEGDVCVVETSDRTPRRIEECPYDKGDSITVTYSKGRAGVESHRPGQ